MTTEPLSPVQSDRFNGIKYLVGNTPLLAIKYKYRDREGIIYAKAEHINMTGSIKDRMAYYILRQAYEQGRIKPGDRIVEATSGNTGIAFAALGRALGHPVTIFIPSWMSQERINLIRCLGAKIVLVSHEEGGFIGSIRKTEEMAQSEQNVFLPRQFSNSANVEAHEQTTGPELWWQLQFASLRPDAFIAGVGTGGTIMGVGKFLKRKNPGIRLHPLEPSESPTLSTGHQIGHHRIQGISDEFIPPIVNLTDLNAVVNIHDGDAILTAQKLASQLGIAVGISSGANVAGAILIQNELGDDAVVATVLPDDNKKYLSTDLLKEEPVKDGYISPKVDFINYRAHKRVCHTCCDIADCDQHIADGMF